MKKRWIYIMAFAGMTSISHADNDADDRLKAAGELVKTLNVGGDTDKKAQDRLVSELEKDVSEKRRTQEQVQPELDAAKAGRIRADHAANVPDALARLYAGALSLDELKEILAFAQSPAGKKFLDLQEGSKTMQTGLEHGAYERLRRDATDRLINDQLKREGEEAMAEAERVKAQDAMDAAERDGEAKKRAEETKGSEEKH